MTKTTRRLIAAALSLVLVAGCTLPDGTRPEQSGVGRTDSDRDSDNPLGDQPSIGGLGRS